VLIFLLSSLRLSFYPQSYWKQI